VGGTLKCINSTVTGNQGFGVGGMGAARLLLRSSTVTANVATMVGTGGVLAATAMNSIIADNVGPKNDCQELVSRGYNLVEDTSGCAIRGTTIGNVTGVDPLLGPLADNGGPTPTRALLPGSAAIDAANPNPNRCTITDQRGVARSGRCDIGAYEAP
jgi:hypothetical protein